MSDLLSPRRVLTVFAMSVALLASSTTVAAAPCWAPPVIAPVADPYREPACRWCPGNRGIEYETSPGTPVRAVATGRVTFAGAVAGRQYVVVRLAGGWRITYGDLRDVWPREGDVVVAGTIVGTTDDRFHFGVRDRSGYRDPAPFIGRFSYLPRLVPVDGSPGGPAGSPVLRCARGLRR